MEFWSFGSTLTKLRSTICWFDWMYSIVLVSVIGFFFFFYKFFYIPHYIQTIETIAFFEDARMQWWCNSLGLEVWAITAVYPIFFWHNHGTNTLGCWKKIFIFDTVGFHAPSAYGKIWHECFNFAKGCEVLLYLLVSNNIFCTEVRKVVSKHNADFTVKCVKWRFTHDFKNIA